MKFGNAPSGNYGMKREDARRVKPGKQNLDNVTICIVGKIPTSDAEILHLVFARQRVGHARQML